MRLHVSHLPLVLAICAGGSVCCAPITDTQRDTVVARRLERTQNQRAPTRDRTAFETSVEGDTVIVRVWWEPMCRVRDRETLVVDRETVRTADGGIVVGETLLGTLGGALVYLYGYGTPSDERAAPIAGALFAAGVAAPLIDAWFARDSVERLELRRPASQERIEPCGPTPMEGQGVSIAGSGFTINAAADDHGVAKFPIGADVWDRNGNVLDLEVRLGELRLGGVRVVRGTTK